MDPKENLGNKPEEEKKPKKKSKGKKNSKMLELHRKFSTLGVDEFDPSIANASKSKALRVGASFVKDKNNPKQWYLRFVNITPASNINRPMEPTFNTEFNDNGTNGVPRFVDLDVKWTGFANTYMFDQVAYQAIQSIRKSLKSNLAYDQEKVRACLVNGIALCCCAKMLERDVHWNLYSGSSDYNFSEMFRLRNSVIGTYGIVPLSPANALLDENLAYTSAIYDKIVSLFNQVIYLPKTISEFISHYFGSLFTLDKDGFNDQYLRIFMTLMDYYYLKEDKSGYELGAISPANMSLDELLSKINAYSREFAIVLADLQKCVGVTNMKILRYDDYVYTFIYDKSLLQALINGYTTNKYVKNNFVRLDQMPQVEDNLTQFLFMGGIQPEDRSVSRVNAITIQDMVLKCNSSDQIIWPISLDQLNIEQGIAPDAIVNDQPFGLSITSDIINDTTVDASYSSGEDTDAVVSLTTYPDEGPTASARTGINLTYGMSTGANFPDTNGFDFGNISESYNLCGAVYLGCLIQKNDSIYTGYYYFAYAKAKMNDVSVLGTDKPASQTLYMRFTGAKLALNQLNGIIKRKNQTNFFFWSATDGYIDSNFAANFAAHIDVTSLGLTLVTCASDNSTIINNLVAVNYTKHVPFYGAVSVTAYIHIESSAAPTTTYSITFGGPGNIFLPTTMTIAPSGLGSLRSAEQAITTSDTITTLAASTGFDGLADYVCQVIDYHIPVYYTRRFAAKLTVGTESVATLYGNSAPVLMKEDYIPYYYNVLDLIPVLYEMFVSLFAIDNIQKGKIRRRDK